MHARILVEEQVVLIILLRRSTVQNLTAFRLGKRTSRLLHRARSPKGRIASALRMRLRLRHRLPCLRSLRRSRRCFHLRLIVVTNRIPRRLTDDVRHCRGCPAHTLRRNRTLRISFHRRNRLLRRLHRRNRLGRNVALSFLHRSIYPRLLGIRNCRRALTNALTDILPNVLHRNSTARLFTCFTDTLPCKYVHKQHRQRRKNH